MLELAGLARKMAISVEELPDTERFRSVREPCSILEEVSVAIVRHEDDKCGNFVLYAFEFVKLAKITTEAILESLNSKILCLDQHFTHSELNHCRAVSYVFRVKILQTTALNSSLQM